MKPVPGGNLPPDSHQEGGMAPESAPACRRCRAPLAPGLHGNCASCLLDLAGDTEVLDRHAAERIPVRVGGYELVAPIAAGGMGVVYRARQEGLGRDVALKLISTGRRVRPEQVQRFYTEARAVARLAHPHIVPVHAAGEDDGRHYLAMPLMEGGTLAERLDSLPSPGSPERLRSAATWIATVARAVHHAHRHGVLHRDLKPANILFDAAGQPHVADFGLARLLDEESGLTRSQVLLGTPDYLAPEAAREGAAAATVSGDVFSLGAMLYEVLCGFPPFAGPTPLETLRRASEGDAPPPSRRRPRAPARPSAEEARLDRVCLKALAPDPAGRYASAQDLAEDLERWLRGEALVARPESAPERLARIVRRNPALSLALAAFALSVLAGVGVALRQGRDNARNLYAADLHLASGAVAEGDLGLARELLERHRQPRPDFAWRRLRHLAEGDERTVLDLHPWIVNAVEVSPDGRRVLSGSVGSGTVGDAVRLAPMEPGEPARAFGTNGARAFGWFPDGKRFLAAHVDGRIRRWDVASGRVEREIPGLALALSADGRRLVTCEGGPFPWAGSPTGPAWLRHVDDDTGPTGRLGARSIRADACGRWSSRPTARSWSPPVGSRRCGSGGSTTPGPSHDGWPVTPIPPGRPPSRPTDAASSPRPPTRRCAGGMSATGRRSASAGAMAARSGARGSHPTGNGSSPAGRTGPCSPGRRRLRRPIPCFPTAVPCSRSSPRTGPSW